MNDKLALV